MHWTNTPDTYRDRHTGRKWKKRLANIFIWSFVTRCLCNLLSARSFTRSLTHSLRHGREIVFRRIFVFRFFLFLVFRQRGAEHVCPRFRRAKPKLPSWFFFLFFRLVHSQSSQSASRRVQYGACCALHFHIERAGDVCTNETTTETTILNQNYLFEIHFTISDPPSVCSRVYFSIGISIRILVCRLDCFVRVQFSTREWVRRKKKQMASHINQGNSAAATAAKDSNKRQANSCTTALYPFHVFDVLRWLSIFLAPKIDLNIRKYMNF